MTDRIAIIGVGVMGETLVSTLLAAGVEPGRVVAVEKRPERAAELRERHGIDVAGLEDAVRDADLVLLVTKPQDVPGVLEQAGPLVAPGAAVVSFAAGVRTATIEAAVPDGVEVLRVMPNTPALVGQGVFGVSAGASCSDERVAAVRRLLEPGGTVVVVDEDDQDALTAVSGSGPAYVFYLAEAMIAGGVEAGLDPATAHRLAVATIQGSAALLAGSDDEPAELRRRVTSPNGTTAAAIETFDERGVKQAVADGVRAAAARSAELSGPGA